MDVTPSDCSRHEQQPLIRPVGKLTAPNETKLALDQVVFYAIRPGNGLGLFYNGPGTDTGLTTPGESRKERISPTLKCSEKKHLALLIKKLTSLKYYARIHHCKLRNSAVQTTINTISIKYKPRLYCSLYHNDTHTATVKTTTGKYWQHR